MVRVGEFIKTNVGGRLCTFFVKAAADVGAPVVLELVGTGPLVNAGLDAVGAGPRLVNPGLDAVGAGVRVDTLVVVEVRRGCDANEK